MFYCFYLSSQEDPVEFCAWTGRGILGRRWPCQFHTGTLWRESPPQSLDFRRQQTIDRDVRKYNWCIFKPEETGTGYDKE